HSFPRYPDFIVGSGTWRAETKLQDLLVIPGFTLAWVGALMALTTLFQVLGDRAGHRAKEALLAHLAGWCLPVVVGVATFLTDRAIPRELLNLSAAGVLGLGICTGWTLRCP